jgi:hypothetical protein
MQNITTAIELKEAIQILEFEQAFHKRQMNEQFLMTIDSFKPARLLKASLKEMIEPQNIIENLLGIGLGLATGFVSRKIITGASMGIARMLIGTISQMALAKVVVQNTSGIVSKATAFLHKRLDKKELNP